MIWSETSELESKLEILPPMTAGRSGHGCDVVNDNSGKKFLVVAGGGADDFSRNSGTDVMIFEIFSQKNLAKIVIITLVFEKNANFLTKIVKNRRKLSS
jgi:hypothetical protein